MPPPSRRVAPLCEGPDPPPPSGLGVVEAKGGQGLRLGFSRTTTARTPRSTNGWARLSPRPLRRTSRGQLRRLRGGRVRAFRGGIARRRGPAFLTAGCRPSDQGVAVGDLALRHLAPAGRRRARDGQSRRGRLPSSLSRRVSLGTANERRSGLSACALGLSALRSVRKRRQTRVLLGPTGRFECSFGNGRCGGQKDGHGQASTPMAGPGEPVLGGALWGRTCFCVPFLVITAVSG